MQQKRHVIHMLLVFMLGLFGGYELQKAKELPTPCIAHHLEKEGFLVLYDGRCKTPYCVVEQLSKESLAGLADRSKQSFKEDKRLARHLRATLADYKGSSYDRGHLAPAANHKQSQQGMGDSFLLSNICPQDPSFNRVYWSHFEQHVRELTQQYKCVTVYTGPLYLPQGAPGKRFVHYPVIGPNDVAVPTHFFKVLQLEETSGFIEKRAYIMPNQSIQADIPLESFQVTVEKIETLSGMLFPAQ